jgi:hypothetical protein
MADGLTSQGATRLADEGVGATLRPADEGVGTTLRPADEGVGTTLRPADGGVGTTEEPTRASAPLYLPPMVSQPMKRVSVDLPEVASKKVSLNSLEGLGSLGREPAA